MAQRYTLAQLYQLALNAGFRGVNAVIAAAIAMAESGGNPTSYNPETQAGTAPGQGSYGLWQVYRTAHPQYSASYLDTPQGSADAAFQIYQQAGNSFTPWSTFKSGAYKQYFQQLISTVVNTATLGGNSGAQAGAQAGGSSGIASALTNLQTGSVSALHSIGWFTLALAILLFGAWLLFEPQIEQATTAVKNTASRAAEVAAVAA